jgi:hypothetical protein
MTKVKEINRQTYTLFVGDEEFEIASSGGRRFYVKNKLLLSIEDWIS